MKRKKIDEAWIRKGKKEKILKDREEGGEVGNKGDCPGPTQGWCMILTAGNKINLYCYNSNNNNNNHKLLLLLLLEQNFTACMTLVSATACWWQLLYNVHCLYQNNHHRNDLYMNRIYRTVISAICGIDNRQTLINSSRSDATNTCEICTSHSMPKSHCIKTLKLQSTCRQIPC